jgi:ribosomal protein S12 methylthiotransferase
VGLISLGCAKNLVDSEIMLGTLVAEGMEITNDAATADVVIVNTCSFIDSAQEESVEAILESNQLRTVSQPGQGLVVSGCLPQRFRDELPKLLPEVDAFMGIDQVAQVGTIVRQALERRKIKLASGKSAARPKNKLPAPLKPTNGVSEIAPENPLVQVNARPQYIPDFGTPRFRLTPKHFAYLKIAEGCNHPCSFCIIPRMRGTHRSRVQSDIVAEARALIADGVKEINLISQDSTYYGLDLRPNHSRAIASPERFSAAIGSLPEESSTLCSLIRALNDLPGDFWIRILYTHPAHWTDELIRTIADCPKVARYVDIPLQHIHDVMLERMRRETTSEYISGLIKRIRAGVPGIALRTTFIVGFPGETEPYFEALLDFMRAVRFERLGIFTYSKEPGTRAGGMAGQITDRVKRSRRDRAMALQREIVTEISQAAVGKTMKVLVEGRAESKDLESANILSWEHGLMRSGQNGSALPDGAFYVARSQADAPDIDGRVYIRTAQTLAPGEFCKINITGHTGYDLIAAR